MLPEIDHYNAMQFAEKIRKLVEVAEFKFEDAVIPVTVSIGVASLRGEIEDALEFIKQADTQLFAAKEGGRNQVKGSPADRAMDSARELREKKRVLAALVVHDLRSPLSAVGRLPRAAARRARRRPRRRAREPTSTTPSSLLGKALGLVATILDVDELEDGMLRAHSPPVRLVELIERARAGNRAHFEVRQLRCDVDVDPTTRRAARSRSVRRVIENLLDNATRYAPRGGRCAITAQRDARRRRDRDRQQRSAGAGRGARADLRALLPGRAPARVGAREPRPRACTSASSRSRRTAARSTSRSAAISARCSSRGLPARERSPRQ